MVGICDQDNARSSGIVSSAPKPIYSIRCDGSVSSAVDERFKSGDVGLASECGADGDFLNCIGVENPRASRLRSKLSSDHSRAASSLKRTSPDLIAATREIASALLALSSVLKVWAVRFAVLRVLDWPSDSELTARCACACGLLRPALLERTFSIRAPTATVRAKCCFDYTQVPEE